MRLNERNTVKVKRLLSRLPIHRLPSGENFLVGFSCIVRFYQWTRKNPCRSFNDNPKSNRLELFAHVLESEGLEQTPFTFLEFGVATGRSFAWWTEHAKHMDSRFHGFDTFTGLPEVWDGVQVGTFSTNGRPPSTSDKRAQFHAGLFSITLPKFLSQSPPKGRLLLHLDADLYSSTLFVLTSLAPFLKKGDILMFDEIGSLRHPTSEFRALQDFLTAYPLTYTVIGAANYHLQAVLKLG